jgi:hypothetical protein
MRRVILQLVAAGVVGCSGSTVPSRAWTAQFIGVVHDEAGLAVPNAQITVRGIDLSGGSQTKQGNCTGATVNLPVGAADANGRYSLTMNSGGPPLFACIFVNATGTVAGRTVSGAVERDSLVIGPTGSMSIETNVTIRQ